MRRFVFFNPIDRAVDQTPYRQQHLLARGETMSGEFRGERRKERRDALANLLARVPRVLERFVRDNARKRPSAASSVFSHQGTSRSSICAALGCRQGALGTEAGH